MVVVPGYGMIMGLSITVFFYRKGNLEIKNWRKNGAKREST